MNEVDATEERARRMRAYERARYRAAGDTWFPGWQPRAPEIRRSRPQTSLWYGLVSGYYPSLKADPATP